jgi:hypothetical protein
MARVCWTVTGEIRYYSGIGRCVAGAYFRREARHVDHHDPTSIPDCLSLRMSKSCVCSRKGASSCSFHEDTCVVPPKKPHSFIFAAIFFLGWTPPPFAIFLNNSPLLYHHWNDVCGNQWRVISASRSAQKAIPFCCQIWRISR